MTVSDTWTLTGAEGLPIYGNTHTPPGAPRAVAILVHGWTGCKDRNINPGVATFLSEQAGITAHRITLSHSGMEKDSDQITRTDEFERDSNAFCIHDVRHVVEAIHDDTIPGRGLPLILIGHSRGGATVYRCAAEAVTEAWPIRPVAIISLAATATLTRLTEEMRQDLADKGYVERECGRTPGGIVRMGRSWYEHHLDEPHRDHFTDAVGAIRCPVLIAHGEDDTSVPLSHADEIEELFQVHNAGIKPRRRDIPGADHNFNILGLNPSRDDMFNPAAQTLYGAIATFLDASL